MALTGRASVACGKLERGRVQRKGTGPPPIVNHLPDEIEARRARGPNELLCLLFPAEVVAVAPRADQPAVFADQGLDRRDERLDEAALHVDDHPIERGTP